eukprot:CAMPEP_0181103906 /NCGR_PEP_ID=MMETSP1071-20121207/15133_1 /TAXON_ID=35127 /ORGANISM="Thalassiosira sp., Strain NH16" /LENGTH=692 /DNA_ID=CAMNT_0023187047 /DNA_START=49 /DNA_END=2127 /DNA_ORIENTATION=-
MKTVPIILSLAASATAQASNIRASKLVERRTKSSVSSTASTKDQEKGQQTKLHPLQKNPDGLEAREARSHRKVIGDHIHRRLKKVQEKHADEASSSSNKKKEANVDLKAKPQQESGEEDRELKKITNEDGNKILTDKTQENRKTQESSKTENLSPEEKGQELSKEERELKKSKSGKGGWGRGWGGNRGGFGGKSDKGSWKSGGGWGDHSGPGHYDDDDWGSGGGWGDHSGPGHYDDDDWGHGGGHDGGWDGGHGGGHGGGWGGSWSGKSGKSGGQGGKSGKGSWGGGYGGKSDKGSWGAGSGGWGGKSDKGGWDGNGGDRGDDWGHSGGGWCHEHAHVRITNLSWQQEFSEIFVMTHEYGVTKRFPIYEFGQPAKQRLATLAQDADASDIEDFYQGRFGVEMTKIFRDFDSKSGYETDFLRGGQTVDIKVATGGYGHRLSLAVGLPFTNDGAVVLQNEEIYDGAEHYLPAIDAGVEGNIETCWSVAANRMNFPPTSVCYDEDFSDDNDNNVPGESFVGMHRGIQDLDSKNDLEDLLFLPTCEDFDLDDSTDTDRFSEYFYLAGFDDDLLLCSNAFGSRCNPRDDEEFLDFLKDADDYTDDDRYVEVAKSSTDFEDFCDNIKDENKAINDAFKTLEPWLFDWRNEMMKVEISCGGWHADGWGDDGYHGDHGNDSPEQRFARLYDDDDDRFGFN